MERNFDNKKFTDYFIGHIKESGTYEVIQRLEHEWRFDIVEIILYEYPVRNSMHTNVGTYQKVIESLNGNHLNWNFCVFYKKIL